MFWRGLMNPLGLFGFLLTGGGCSRAPVGGPVELGGVLISSSAGWNLVRVRVRVRFRVRVRGRVRVRDRDRVRARIRIRIRARTRVRGRGRAYHGCDVMLARAAASKLSRSLLHLPSGHSPNSARRST